jgi:putative cell wall-binding protein
MIRRIVTRTAGLVLAAALAVPVAALAQSDPLRRISGYDRYATAAAIARDGAGTSRVPHAVLARGDDFADALAGVPLAGHLGAPLLLTRPSDLPAATDAALADLVTAGATIHLLGGTAAIGESVVDTLEERGYATRRYQGVDRYGTAASIARVLPSDTLAYLVSGLNPADALAAAAIAGAESSPVLLTPPDRLPLSTRTALSNRPEVRIVGGSAVIGAAVRQEVRDTGVRVVEIAGADRYATALALARRYRPAASDTGMASGTSWADALTGARHAAALGWPLLLTGPGRVPYTVAAEVTDNRTGATVYGGTAAVNSRAYDDVRRALDSDPGAPAQVSVSPGPVVGPGTEIDLRFATRIGSAQLEVRGVNGAAVTTSDTSVLVRLPDTMDAGSYEIEVVGHVTDTSSRRRYVAEPFTAEVRSASRVSSEGWTVAGGTDAPFGTAGTLWTFSVEVEPATGWDVDDVLPVVLDALAERDRGWTARGERRLQRIDDPGAARIRVVLATPATVDRHCAANGLNTAGAYSCWDGRRAMLNLTRWEQGSPHFAADLATYRRYLVNHEFGHGLGFGHTSCATAGAPAPIMMQQTKGTGACSPNGWPYP